MDLTSLNEMADSFDGTADAIGPALEEAMVGAMADLAAYVRENELSGQVLRSRSGRLRDSVQAAVGGSGTLVSGMVTADTSYAAIHEYGGVIERSPRRQPARRLRKPDAGRIVEPERSYLRPALAYRSDDIAATLTASVMEILT